VAKKAEETVESNEETSLVSELAEEEDLSLEEQLRIVEEEAVGKDKSEDGKDDHAAESEDSEETVDASANDDEIPPEFQSAVKQEVSLQMRIQQLEAENAALKQSSSVAESDEDEGDEELDFDIGEIDPAYEDLRETLNGIGKLALGENKQLERKVNAIMEHLENQTRQMTVTQVKAAMQIDDAEEPRIVEWAQENGLRFHDQKTLQNVVKLYRNEQERIALKAEKEKRTRASANPRTTRKSQSSTASNSTESGSRTFEDSWAKGLRTINEKIQRGELR